MRERPRMVAVQSDGCAPIVRAFERGERFAEPFRQRRHDRQRHSRAGGGRRFHDPRRRSAPAAAGRLPSAKRASASGWRSGMQSEGLAICPETAACIGALEMLRDRALDRAGRASRDLQHRRGAEVSRSHERAATATGKRHGNQLGPDRRVVGPLSLIRGRSSMGGRGSGRAAAAQEAFRPL